MLISLKMALSLILWFSQGQPEKQQSPEETNQPNTTGQNIVLPVGERKNGKQHLANNLWLRHQVFDTLELRASGKVEMKDHLHFCLRDAV